MSSAESNARKAKTSEKPSLPRPNAEWLAEFEAATRRPLQEAEWLAEFEAAARRPLATRMLYAFIRTYKPVLDDARYRSFDSMADYRAWCRDSLPDWLGFGPARDSP